MKKKLMALFTAAVLATTVFAGCGDSSAETDTDVEATSSDEACSDETFSTLQDNYAAMVEAYNAVKELYESDAVEADADIEDVLNQAAVAVSVPDMASTAAERTSKMSIMELFKVSASPSVIVSCVISPISLMMSAA